LLLDGFARYRRDGGCGRLVLIGTGPGRGVVSDRARALDLGAAIEINGPRFGTEKLAAMRLWDFFVQTSRFEAMPMGCLEAAYHGLPLIASAEAGLAAEIERHRAGITVSPLTAGAVAEALGYAERLSAAERSEMGRRAAEMAREIGDWTQIAAALRQLYCASAGRRPRRFAAWVAAAGVRPLRDEPDDRAP
jgi:glycosyltransferase involved in cell wall biosynthesis